MSPPTKYTYKHMVGGREKKKGIWKVSGESRVSFCPYLPMTERFLGNSNFSTKTRKVPRKLVWVGREQKQKSNVERFGQLSLWLSKHNCNPGVVTCDQIVLGRTQWTWIRTAKILRFFRFVYDLPTLWFGDFK